MAEAFSTGGQYNDWKGELSADELDGGMVSDFVRTKLGLPQSTYVLGIEFFRAVPEFVTGRAIYVEADSYEAAQELQASAKSISLEMTEMEFLTLFKRFSLVMERKGFEIIGKEFDDA